MTKPLSTSAQKTLNGDIMGMMGRAIFGSRVPENKGFDNNKVAAELKQNNHAATQNAIDPAEHLKGFSFPSDHPVVATVKMLLKHHLADEKNSTWSSSYGTVGDEHDDHGMPATRLAAILLKNHTDVPHRTSSRDDAGALLGVRLTPENKLLGYYANGNTPGAVHVFNEH